MTTGALRSLCAGIFLMSMGLILYELLLTRLFAVVLFAQFAHLALALALLGMGVGATLQHLWPRLVPAEHLHARLGRLAILQGILTFAAIWASIRLPVMVQFETPPLTYQERSFIRDDLLNPVWFVVLLPILAAPFACAGVAFSGAFQRAKAFIGQVYGADLVGGAIGAVLFIPVLMILAGPDAVFAILLCLGAAAWTLGARLGGGVLGAVGVLGGLLALRGELLPIKATAGYAEELVTYTQWTPLTRLAVHEDPRRGTHILLDNTSASEVFQDTARLQSATREANRALVYHLHPPTGRVAILAASAGPEVAIARHFGFSRIDAIDIAAEIFELVAARYPDSPVNPYADGTVRRVYADGRAAILQAREPYDIIQMVHANLWSSAGLLSNSWSPSLLETRDAFETYLEHLSPEGTLSFGRGTATDALLCAAAAALRRQGAPKPWQHIVYIKGRSTVLLIKPRPWSEADLAALDTALETFPEEKTRVFDTRSEKAPPAYRKILSREGVMTDDRPYLDTPEIVGESLQQAFSTLQGENEKPLAVLYRSVVLQLLFVVLAGSVFLGVPLLWRGRSEMAGISGLGAGILYIMGLGYGYLAVEIVLIHELVLFVGHPTYAITAVVLGMLLFSGLGSILVDRLQGNLTRWLQGLLLGLVALCILQVVAVAPLLYGSALGLPLLARAGLTLLAMAPLGLLMGMPFALGMRILPPASAAVIPWFWAINSWMSVVASLMTVLLSRLYGYSTALWVAILAYGLCLLVAHRLSRILPSAPPTAARPATDPTQVPEK